MAHISTLFYSTSRCLYTLATICESTSITAEQQFGNPVLPDEIFVIFVLAILGFRRTVIVSLLVLWASRLGTAEGRTVFYSLSEAGNLSAVLSR